MNNILSQNSRAKDSILNACLNRHKQFLSPNQLTTLIKEKDRLGANEYKLLIKEISNFEVPVAQTKITDNKCLIASNANTEIFLKDGGFTKLNEDRNLSTYKNLNKENLEIEKLELEKENAEYAKSLRSKDEEIKNLTIINLKLQNRNLKRYILYSVISFIVGAITSNFDKFKQLYCEIFLK